VTRPRAAEDFPAIRAGMEELRRERAQALAERRGRSADPPEALSSRRERIRPKASATEPLLMRRRPRGARRR
jgi:hypothetical protein